VKTANLSVIVLTFNEEKHLARCLKSIEPVAQRILVVDSYSSDETVAIARSFGAEVLQNPWLNHATQFNWALDNNCFDTAWIMRLDADEVLLPEVTQSLLTLEEQPARVSGLTVTRRIYFLDQWMRYGGLYPVRSLRVWRTGLGRCENRWMDEHIVVRGDVGHLQGDIADMNLNDVTWWTSKHNSYASREAAELLLLRYGSSTREALPLDRHARAKRWMKERVYARLPLGIRAVSYFIYRYFLRLGFLDGWRGFAFHVLQGLWYRFLVDVKLYELERTMREHRWTVEEMMQRMSSHAVTKPPEGRLQ
jgi:glycosyltransferase involved in cell wall biosynthesis